MWQLRILYHVFIIDNNIPTFILEIVSFPWWEFHSFPLVCAGFISSRLALSSMLSVAEDGKSYKMCCRNKHIFKFLRIPAILGYLSQFAGYRTLVSLCSLAYLMPKVSAPSAIPEMISIGWASKSPKDSKVSCSLNFLQNSVNREKNHCAWKNFFIEWNEFTQVWATFAPE